MLQFLVLQERECNKIVWWDKIMVILHKKEFVFSPVRLNDTINVPQQLDHMKI